MKPRVKILADTSVFIYFCRRLPLPAPVEQALAAPDTERYLSPVTILELFRQWQRGTVLENPDTWLDLALPSWRVLDVTVPIARQSALWDWPHKDPADRLLAATACVERVELWHMDQTLKKFTGFPQRYFHNVLTQIESPKSRNLLGLAKGKIKFLDAPGKLTDTSGEWGENQ